MKKMIMMKRGVLHHADTGIGTYKNLDGEAIFEDGVAFGTVAAFDENVPEVEMKNITDIEKMKEALEPYIAENKNVFYMIKATGKFKTMHVRSCYLSQKPYPTLSAVAENQREFHSENTSGSLIAVFCPAYINGINVKINKIERFDLTLPQNEEFAKRNLCEDLSAKTAAVEGNKK